MFGSTVTSVRAKHGVDAQINPAMLSWGAGPLVCHGKRQVAAKHYMRALTQTETLLQYIW